MATRQSAAGAPGRGDPATTRRRDAEATKKRILAAATAEFATHGIAGARVDRIAASADANKSLIYAYFGSKDGLFDAVFDAAVVATVDQFPIDVDDLPAYAARLYDYRLAQPDPLRLANWDRLERDGAGIENEAVQAALATKVKAISRAQRTGKVSKALSPAALLEFIVALSQTGLDAEPGSRGATAHRKRIAAAVRQMVAG
jgi:AcrR family transcriptional regulator